MKKHAGFSLIEVAIAMGVMAVGLSGLCALLINSTFGMSSLSHRATATRLARRLSAEMALAPMGLGALPTESPAPADCSDAPCAPALFNAFNYGRWQEDVSKSLPGGAGVVCFDNTPEDGEPGRTACDDAGRPVVKVFWRKAGRAAVEWDRYTLELSP